MDVLPNFFNILISLCPISSSDLFDLVILIAYFLSFALTCHTEEYEPSPNILSTLYFLILSFNI